MKKRYILKNIRNNLIYFFPNIKEAKTIIIILLIYYMAHFRILLVYFSWTGNTRYVAQEISKHLSINNEVDICEIIPQKSRKYFQWLLMSFIPGLKVKIQSTINDISKYDLLIVGSPKWTLNSPPLNEYLNSLIGCNEQMAAIFITFGGYGAKKYILKIENSLIKKGLQPVESFTIKRSSLNKGEKHEIITSFCNNIQNIISKKVQIR